MASPKVRKPAWTVAMDRLAHDQAVLRWIAVIGGVLAIAISFPQLRWVYQEFIGLPVAMAYLVPLMIDLLAVMFAGIVGTTVGAPRPARMYAWAGLGFFVAVSIAGNAMHAWWHQTGEYLPDTLAAGTGWVILMFAAMPPIGATLGIHGRSFLDRAGVDADRAAPAPGRAPAAHTPEPRNTQPARTPEPRNTQPARTPTAVSPRTTSAHEQAHQLFNMYGPGRGVGARIHRELTQAGVPTPDPATVRRWVQGWTADLDNADTTTARQATEKLSA